MPRRFVHNLWAALPFLICGAVLLGVPSCSTMPAKMDPQLDQFSLEYDTPTDPPWQARLEAVDAELRAKYGMATEQTAVGVLDLRQLRLAWLHPDREEYAASV